MDSTVFLARQPIVDREGKLFAYELLFRGSEGSNSAMVTNGMLATAKVLENALSGIGLETLLGNHKGFVNCSREMLTGHVPTILDPNSFVLEILEDVLPDDEVVAGVAKVHKLGFEIALDDFVFTEENCRIFEPYFKYLSYIKVDLVENSPEVRAGVAKFFKDRGIKLLAEKVETKEDVDACLENGFEFFQGYYFARPEIMTGNQVPASASAILQLLRDLRYEPTAAELAERISSQFPEVETALMRYAKSSMGYKRSSEMTVLEALEWIGRRHLHTWLMMLLYSRSIVDAGAFQSPLFKGISNKAKFMENLALSIAPDHSNLFADAFLVGIVSRIEDFVDVPRMEALQVIAVAPEVRDAVADHAGPLGMLLQLADAVEKKELRTVVTCMRKLSISHSTLQQCLNDAFTWSAYYA